MKETYTHQYQLHVGNMHYHCFNSSLLHASIMYVLWLSTSISCHGYTTYGLWTCLVSLYVDHAYARLGDDHIII